MADVVKFCNDNMNVPDGLDDAFVLDFERSPPDEKTNKWFRFFVTTKRLLQTTVDAECMHADGTYRVMVEQYPLIVIGVTDKAQSFHLIGLGITNHETDKDYEFMFNAVKKGMMRVLNRSIAPRFLVSDAAPAIRNGFTLVFPDAETTIMCFAHVKMNARKAKYKNQANRSTVDKNITQLHLLPTKKQFEVGTKLFEK